MLQSNAGGILWPWALSVAERWEKFRKSTRIYQAFAKGNRVRSDELAPSHMSVLITSLFLSLFPLCFLSGHATLVCSGFVLLLDALWLRETWGRGLRLSFCERTACLLALLFLLGGFFGAGDSIDGIVAALGVTVLFPVRHAARGGAARLRIAMLAGAVPVALLGIWQYWFSDLPLLWTDTERFSDIGTRVTSVFSNPNILAVYLLLILPAGLWEFFRSVGKRRVFAFFSSVALLLCLVFTWSRGAWLGAIAEILPALLSASRKSCACLVLSPVVLVGALPFLPHSIYNRFGGIFTLGETSVRYRCYTWKGVLQLLRAHPFGIGVGEQAFSTVYPAYAVSGTERVMHAHNVFLQIATEIGFPGLFCFLLLLLAALLPSLGGRRDGSAVIAVFGACVMGMFDHLWYARGMLILFFAVLGIALGGNDDQTKMEAA